VKDDGDPDGELTSQFILTLKDNGSGNDAAESSSEAVEAAVARLEQQRLPATINDTLPEFNQVAINIETPPPSKACTYPHRYVPIQLS
jgi:hypothetical protein